MRELNMTDTTLTLLALIAAKPLNPYRINKALSGIENDKFYKIKESTCYASIRLLEKNGLISGESRQESNMPAKKIYSLTEEGRRILQENLVMLLSNLENTSSSFEKAITFICSITKAEAIKAIQKHKKKLESDLEILRNQFSEYRLKSDVPFTVKILKRQMIKKRQVELDTLNELKKEIEWDQKWDHYPVDIMKI